MSLFNIISKERYINHLVLSYKIVYGCGDMAAIECLRKYYTKIELGEIYEALKQSEKSGSLQSVLFLAHPFKENRETVMEIDNKYNGG